MCYIRVCKESEESEKDRKSEKGEGVQKDGLGETERVGGVRVCRRMDYQSIITTITLSKTATEVTQAQHKWPKMKHVIIQ